MDTIYSLLKRAKELKEKSQVDSITPEEVGKLHEDTLAYIASLEQSTDGLGIKKVYQSKSAMEADRDPVGTNGKALRYGQLVSIYDDTHADSSENGNIYAYQKPGWLLMGKVSELSVVQEAGDSATKVMSQKAVTEAIANVEKKTEELAKKKEVKKEYASLATLYSQSSAYQNVFEANVYASTWKPLEFDVYLSKFTLLANWLKDVTEIANNVVKILVADADGKVVGIHEATISARQYVIDVEDKKILVPKGGYVALMNSNLGTKTLYSDTSVPGIINKWAGASQVGDGMTEKGKNTLNWTPAYSVVYYEEKEDDLLKELKSELFKESVGVVGDSSPSNTTATLVPNGWRVLDMDVELTKITLGKAVSEDKGAYLYVSTSEDGYPIDRVYSLSVKKDSSEIDVSSLHITIPKGALCVFSCVGEVFLSSSARGEGVPNVAYATFDKGGKVREDIWNRSLAPNYSIEYKYVSSRKQEQNEEDVHTITVEDMKGVLMCGSSLTYSARQPKSMSWGERLNDMLDINLYNGGISGSTLKDNIQLLASNGAFGFTTKATPSALKPSYILI
jgi:hypothetical protein